MALPIIQTIIPFDATENFLLKFTFSGFQIRKNRLIIKNNQTNQVVYDNTITSTLLRHNIPANTLQNGITYNVQVQVFDINDVPSGLSDMTIFACLSTPTFNFINLNEGDIIHNSYINLQLNYSQSENELLNTYEIQLYNSSKSLIYTTDTKNSDNLEVSVTGLEEDTQYYMKAIGETVNHISLDTGYVSFLCKYVKPSSFSLLELHTNPDEASVTYSSHIISIEGYSNTTPVYIDNKMIDLSSEGVSVKFDEAFDIKGDFTLHLQGKKFTEYEEMFHDSNAGIRLIWWKYYDTDTYSPDYCVVKLEVDGLLGKYILFSDKLGLPTENDMIHIWLRRIGNLYEIRAKNKGDDV